MLFDCMVYCNITLMYQEQWPANHDKTETPIAPVTTSALNKQNDSQTTSNNPTTQSILEPQNETNTTTVTSHVTTSANDSVTTVEVPELAHNDNKQVRNSVCNQQKYLVITMPKTENICL